MSDIETVEPILLPPEDSSGGSSGRADEKEATKPGPEPKNRSGRGIGQGSVVAGLLLDAADAVTIYGWMGMLLGGAIGVYLCIDLKLPPKRWGWVIAIAGIYCALPGTRFIPAGTLFMLGRSMLSQWEQRKD